MRIFSALLLCCTLIAACDQQEESSKSKTSVSIEGTIDGADSAAVIRLSSMPVFGDSEDLAVDTLDESGAFSMTIDIENPTHVRLAMGRDLANLFLHPGDALQVSASAEDAKGTWLFEGTGAKVANYLADRARNEEAYRAKMEDENFYKLEEEQFTEAIFGMQEMHTELLEKRFADDFPSKEFEAFATYDIIGEWAQQLKNYPTYHEYYAGVENFEVSDQYQVVSQKAKLDNDEGLIAPAYRGFAYGYSARKFSDMVTSDTTLQDDWEKAYAQYYNVLKEDDQLSDGIRDFLLASNVNDFISYFGTDEVQPILADYKSNYANVEYLPVIEANYEAWSKLAKGQKAPTFAYQTPKGETVDLAEMKGKIVYVDVWATWCGPCKGEIPASKELKKKFADRDDVVFMYVSVDDKEDSWRNFLNDDPEFKGVHVITGTGWKSKITEDYMIDGIPRYMLIDQQGLIVSASAPRPSSGERIEGMIRELLVDNPSGD